MAKKTSIRSSVYVSVEVDPIDVIYELNDDEFEIIAKSNGYVKQTNGDDRAEVSHAINQIRAGNHYDAVVTLERAFLPTWRDSAACEARYREVMGRAAA